MRVCMRACVCACVHACACVCACVSACELLPPALYVEPVCCVHIVDIVTFPNMAPTVNVLLFYTVSITTSINNCNKEFHSFLTLKVLSKKASPW